MKTSSRVLTTIELAVSLIVAIGVMLLAPVVVGQSQVSTNLDRLVESFGGKASESVRLGLVTLFASVPILTVRVTTRLNPMIRLAISRWAVEAGQALGISFVFSAIAALYMNCVDSQLFSEVILLLPQALVMLFVQFVGNVNPEVRATIRSEIFKQGFLTLPVIWSEVVLAASELSAFVVFGLAIGTLFHHVLEISKETITAWK